MKPVKCPNCGVRLLDAEYVKGEIKCPRCKKVVALIIEKSGQSQ